MPCYSTIPTKLVSPEYIKAAAGALGYAVRERPSSTAEVIDLMKSGVTYVTLMRRKGRETFEADVKTYLTDNQTMSTIKEFEDAYNREMVKDFAEEYGFTDIVETEPGVYELTGTVY